MSTNIWQHKNSHNSLLTLCTALLIVIYGFRPFFSQNPIIPEIPSSLSDEFETQIAQHYRFPFTRVAIDQLESIPGIGAVRAEQILGAREQILSDKSSNPDYEKFSGVSGVGVKTGRTLSSYLSIP